MNFRHKKTREARSLVVVVCFAGTWPARSSLAAILRTNTNSESGPGQGLRMSRIAAGSVVSKIAEYKDRRRDGLLHGELVEHRHVAHVDETLNERPALYRRLVGLQDARQDTLALGFMAGPIDRDTRHGSGNAIGHARDLKGLPDRAGTEAGDVRDAGGIGA